MSSQVQPPPFNVGKIYFSGDAPPTFAGFGVGSEAYDVETGLKYQCTSSTGTWVASRVGGGLTDNTGGTPGATLQPGVGQVVMTYGLDLTTLTTGALSLMTKFPIGFAFKILSLAAVVKIAGTGSGATQAINLALGNTPTNITGGVLTLTLAGTATIGTIVQATSITALNTGAAASGLSILSAASGVVFTAGKVDLLITMQNMDTVNAVSSLN